MYCPNCGNKNDKGARFCSSCGNPMTQKQHQTARMVCNSCHGSLNIENYGEILICPYCGSKDLVIDSDVVKMHRMDIQKEIEIKEIEHRHKLEEDRERDAGFDKYFKQYTIQVVAIMFICLAILIAAKIFGWDF